MGDLQDQRYSLEMILCTAEVHKGESKGQGGGGLGMGSYFLEPGSSRQERGQGRMRQRKEGLNICTEGNRLKKEGAKQVSEQCPRRMEGQGQYTDVHKGAQ